MQCDILILSGQPEDSPSFARLDLPGLKGYNKNINLDLKPLWKSRFFLSLRTAGVFIKKLLASSFLGQKYVYSPKIRSSHNRQIY